MIKRLIYCQVVTYTARKTLVIGTETNMGDMINDMIVKQEINK